MCRCGYEQRNKQVSRRCLKTDSDWPCRADDSDVEMWRNRFSIPPILMTLFPFPSHSHFHSATRPRHMCIYEDFVSASGMLVLSVTATYCTQWFFSYSIVFIAVPIYRIPSPIHLIPIPVPFSLPWLVVFPFPLEFHGTCGIPVFPIPMHISTQMEARFKGLAYINIIVGHTTSW